MVKSVVRLYPQPTETVPLQGLYLRRDWLAQDNEDLPIVYANFLTSMDGRIALKNHEIESFDLPARLKSDEDFMLLLELYAHADCIITHGGYMRSLSAGRLGNVLQLPTTQGTEYLHEWRYQHAMKPNPDIVIVSGSLEFPWHESLDESHQQVHIATGGMASAENYQQWLDKGRNIYQFGESTHVDVNELMHFLNAQGYQSVYLMAGPDLLQDMLRHGHVKHFFMTMSHQLMSGQTFKSLLNGEPLGDAGNMKLQQMYMDVSNSNSLSQWYVEFSFP